MCHTTCAPSPFPFLFYFLCQLFIGFRPVSFMVSHVFNFYCASPLFYLPCSSRFQMAAAADACLNHINTSLSTIRLLDVSAFRANRPYSGTENCYVHRHFVITVISSPLIDLSNFTRKRHPPDVHPTSPRLDVPNLSLTSIRSRATALPHAGCRPIHRERQAHGR